jgi:heme/copper-type cytochrome/quinol oxidase subunit 3
MAILIASEGMLFAAFIATYFYLRFQHPVWPLRGDPEPDVLVPAIAVGALALMSIPVQLWSRAARAGRLGATRWFVLSALVVQVAYLAWAVHDFADQKASFAYSTDAYSSIYYTLLVTDHVHVAAGILFSLWLVAKLAGGLTTYRVNGAQAIAWYWHAVNAITVAVYLTLWSARL